MQKTVYPNLFKLLSLIGLRLKNRITMAPLYLGYAADGGKVSPLQLYHYKLKCSPKCDACRLLVMQGKPAFCPRWPEEKRVVYRELFQ
jgi:hypothetical protein